jgi:hypothetical protein
MGAGAGKSPNQGIASVLAWRTILTGFKQPPDIFFVLSFLPPFIACLSLSPPFDFCPLPSVF